MSVYNSAGESPEETLAEGKEKTHIHTEENLKRGLSRLLCILGRNSFRQWEETFFSSESRAVDVNFGLRCSNPFFPSQSVLPPFSDYASLFPEHGSLE